MKLANSKASRHPKIRLPKSEAKDGTRQSTQERYAGCKQITPRIARMIADDRPFSDEDEAEARADIEAAMADIRARNGHTMPIGDVRKSDAG